MGNKESDAKGGRKSVSGNGGHMTAIATTKEATQTLDKKIEFLEAKVKNEREQAKNLVKQKTNVDANKRRALQHLNRAKKFEAQITKYQAMRSNLDSIQDTLEGAHTNANIVNAMKQGNQQIKQIQKQMQPESLDELADELQEGMQMLDEASDALTRPIGNADLANEEDLAELMKEDDEDLAELMKEDDDEALEEPAVPTRKKPAANIPALPQAPTSQVKIRSDEDAELDALMRDMN